MMVFWEPRSILFDLFILVYGINSLNMFQLRCHHAYRIRQSIHHCQQEHVSQKPRTSPHARDG